MSRLLDKLREHERTTRTVCRVISVLAFALGVAAVVFEWWLTGAAAIAVLVVSCPCGHMLVSSAPMIAALAVSTDRKSVV